MLGTKNNRRTIFKIRAFISFLLIILNQNGQKTKFTILLASNASYSDSKIDAFILPLKVLYKKLHFPNIVLKL